MESIIEAEELYKTLSARTDLEKVSLAGGCFWCLQNPIETIKGVLKTFTGYAGGSLPNPTYAQVVEGKSGYKEAVQVFFDPKITNLNEVLDIFWAQIDPTDTQGQFADKGPQYQTAIFYQNENQKRIAELSKENLGKSGRYDKPIFTQILPFTTFYLAEEHHQDYQKKHFMNYKQYHYFSGRGKYIEEMEDKYGKQK